MTLRPIVHAVLLVALTGAASCTGAATTPPEPVCAAPPEVAWKLPKARRTPLPATVPGGVTLDDQVKAAKLLKDVVFTHARDPDNPWAIAHAMLAIGPETELTNGRKAVDWLFEQYAETFEVCGETYIRFPRSRGDIRIEPHTNLVLKALTENEIPPDYPVTVQGKQLTVGHLYRGALHRTWVAPSEPPGEGAPEGTPVVYDTVSFGPPKAKGSSEVVPGSDTKNWNDVPWTLQALTAYAPDDLRWTADGDHQMDLDVFTHATVERIDAETQALQLAMKSGSRFDKIAASKEGGLIGMTCGGAHMLQGAAHALGRGFGEPGDKERFQTQIDILFWRYRAELDQYNEMLSTQPRYRTLIMMQRLKFLGHFLETTNKLVILGLLSPSKDQEATMRDAVLQTIATVAVLNETGIFKHLGKLNDPATPQVYAGVITNEQLYLDYVGDSAHAYRGMDLAIGHGLYAY